MRWPSVAGKAGAAYLWGRWLFAWLRGAGLLRSFAPGGHLRGLDTGGRSRRFWGQRLFCVAFGPTAIGPIHLASPSAKLQAEGCLPHSMGHPV